MPTISRRRTVVSLYLGNYEAELDELYNQVMKAQRAESVQPKRMSSKSEAFALAKRYDELAEEARESAVEVTVWAVSFRTWTELEEKHPPRPGNQRDQLSGFNRAGFLADLVTASLASDPDGGIDPRDLDKLLEVGGKILDELGGEEMSRFHYAKLEKAAWDMNNSEVDLPKESLAYVITQANGAESRRRSASE